MSIFVRFLSLVECLWTLTGIKQEIVVFVFRSLCKIFKEDTINLYTLAKKKKTLKLYVLGTGGNRDVASSPGIARELT